jgi:uncharacterized membrane protein YkvA (DUF1232 family)
MRAWQVLAALAGGVLALWLALVLVLLVARPKGVQVQEALRLLPDTLRLLYRLAADASQPRSVRVRLWLLLAYLALPFDLIPDFIPVLGYADDVIIAFLVLRAVVRRVGGGAVSRHWPGSDDGLRALWRVAGLPGDPDSTPRRESATSSIRGRADGGRDP